VQQFLQYTILGLVLGAVYGIAACGLVVTYTTSGIFNFAHGAIAMLGTFAYWQVRYGWGWPAPLALLLVLGIAAPLLGAGLYLGVMRGLRGTSEVTRIVVPISVMLGFLALSTWVWDPTPSTPRAIQKFFGPDYEVRIAGVNVTWHELIAVAMAVLIAVGLRSLFFHTRSGVAMRGVVDDPALLELTGGRPEVLATLSWALGAFLAVLAGILITPIQGGSLTATALTLLVIDAFAAAMFGRLRSLPRTFVGALALGLAANYVIGYFPSDKWTWTGNFRLSLPMILLFVVLLVLPQDRLRGATVARTREQFRMPTMRSACVGAAVLVAVVVLLSAILADTTLGTLTIGMVFAVIALSLVLLTGYGGAINLAAMSFGAIGAIVVYHYGQHGSGADARSNLVGYALAMVVCAVVGGLVALPALRLRGLYLALATMAFGVFVSRFVLAEIAPRKLPLVHWRFTIFPGGNLVVARPKIGPLDLDSQRAFLLAVTVVFAVLGVGLVAIRHSSYGRKLTALRDSPAACATLGLNVVGLKLSVFMLSAAIAGLGGALIAAQLGSVNPDRFDIFLSLTLLVLTVVGGIGSVSGGLVGGLLTGVAFLAIANTFDKVGIDHPTASGLTDFAAKATLVMPALIGVSLGRNPSGAVRDIVERYSALRDALPVVAGGIAVEAGAYLLTLGDKLSTWWFAVITIALAIILPAAGKAHSARRAHRAGADAVPLELIGIDRPFTDADRAAFDVALDIEEVEHARA
jgi:branched-subunit amino acid ABC-type transport system permease component